MHEKLAELTLTLRDRVGVETGVILDPGAETYPLVDAMFSRISSLETEVLRANGLRASREPLAIRRTKSADGLAISAAKIDELTGAIRSDLSDAIVLLGRWRRRLCRSVAPDGDATREWHGRAFEPGSFHARFGFRLPTMRRSALEALTALERRR